MIKILKQREIEKIEQIYKLFNKYSKEVGFVLKPSIIESTMKGEVIYIEQNNQIVGACKFHKRKDGIITIYEIVVDDRFRGKGLAKQMLQFIGKRGLISLKCPIDNESNKFYKKIGFRLLKIEEGKKRNLNVWVGLLK